MSTSLLFYHRQVKSQVAMNHRLCQQKQGNTANCRGHLLDKHLSHISLKSPFTILSGIFHLLILEIREHVPLLSGGIVSRFSLLGIIKCFAVSSRSKESGLASLEYRRKYVEVGNNRLSELLLIVYWLCDLSQVISHIRFVTLKWGLCLQYTLKKENHEV